MIEHVQLQHLIPKTSVTPDDDKRAGAVDVVKSFGEHLNEALSAVNAQKQESDLITRQFIAGQISDVHSVPIAAEKVSLALELTVQVRNKVIEAYQEIMRIQM